MSFNNSKRDLPQINEAIRAPQMQLITQDGQNVGLVSRSQALSMAREADLDLVILAERGKDGFPVVKIMDYGKVVYEKKKKLAEAKKHQKTIEVKEIKIRPKIGEHDYQTKIKHAIEFLEKGKRVKITLFFRGRENVTKDVRGPELFQKVEDSFKLHGFASNLVHEQDSQMGQVWSRTYYLKSTK